MICPRCGKECEDSESSTCPDCEVRVREAARHVDALQQICADRPDLVHYLEGLLKEVTDKPDQHPGASSPTSIESTSLSPCHIRWRALIGKSRPHFERCKDWQLSEKALARSANGTTMEPQPDWVDEDLSITIHAVEGGDLTVEATWFYGPAEGGYKYVCQLVVTGWDLIMHLNWLTRSIYTLFFFEPVITVERRSSEMSEEADDDHSSTDAIGGLG